MQGCSRDELHTKVHQLNVTYMTPLRPLNLSSDPHHPAPRTYKEGHATSRPAEKTTKGHSYPTRDREDWFQGLLIQPTCFGCNRPQMRLRRKVANRNGHSQSTDANQPS
ncbi:hypothetical protein V2G26_001802 [Clonostachys chloroleuca]